MSIFVGSAIRSWPLDGGGMCSRWLCTAPVRTATEYPVMLDIVEGLVATDPDAAEALEGVFSPRWSYFDAASRSAPQAIHYNEIVVAESDAEERFLIDSVCRLVLRRASDTGVILRDVNRYDPMSVRFARSLVRAARASTLTLAIDTPVAVLQNSQLADLLDDATVLESPEPTGGPRSAPGPVFRHSVPVHVLARLGLATHLSVLGPAGVAYVASARNVTPDRPIGVEGEDLSRSILEAWPPDGWDYLRRGGLAPLLMEPTGFHQQHGPYVFGMSLLSRDFLFTYLTRAIAAPALWQAPASRDLHARVAAARLATRVSTHGGFAQAEALYRSALSFDLRPADRVELLFELANSLAVQKNRAACDKARDWYREAFKALGAVEDEERRLRWRIQLLNGLALVEYHQRHDRRALELENRARGIAERHRASFAYVSEWALRLLNMNTAKLLSARMGDREWSRRYLRENVSRARGTDRERSRAHLASLLFDQKDYQEVIALLEPLLERRAWTSFDVTEEFFCRWLCALSRLASGQHEAFRDELPAIRAMAERFDAVRAMELIGRLASATASDDGPQASLDPCSAGASQAYSSAESWSARSAV